MGGSHSKIKSLSDTVDGTKKREKGLDGCVRKTAQLRDIQKKNGGGKRELREEDCKIESRQKREDGAATGIRNRGAWRKERALKPKSFGGTGRTGLGGGTNIRGNLTTEERRVNHF